MSVEKIDSASLGAEGDQPENSKTSAPIRHRLADTRAAITHKFCIRTEENEEIDGYINVGLYPDGRPGEVFIKIAKQGSTISGLMNVVGIQTSLLLQYGIPLEVIVRKLEHVRFEPSGRTQNSDIRYAKSLVDYIVRWLGTEFSVEYRATLKQNSASTQA